jgi:hypothetical protein
MPGSTFDGAAMDKANKDHAAAEKVKAAVEAAIKGLGDHIASIVALGKPCLIGKTPGRSRSR